MHIKEKMAITLIRLGMGIVEEGVNGPMVDPMDQMENASNRGITIAEAAEVGKISLKFPWTILF